MLLPFPHFRITYGSSEVKKLFAGYFSLQAYLVPSENTPGNKVATYRSFTSSEMNVFSSQKLSIIFYFKDFALFFLFHPYLS